MAVLIDPFPDIFNGAEHFRRDDFRRNAPDRLGKALGKRQEADEEDHETESGDAVHEPAGKGAVREGNQPVDREDQGEHERGDLADPGRSPPDRGPGLLEHEERPQHLLARTGGKYRRIIN